MVCLDPHVMTSVMQCESLNTDYLVFRVVHTDNRVMRRGGVEYHSRIGGEIIRASRDMPARLVNSWTRSASIRDSQSKSSRRQVKRTDVNYIVSGRCVCKLKTAVVVGCFNSILLCFICATDNINISADKLTLI